MYKCLDCGHTFDDGEEARTKEYHGDIHGIPEEFAYCPVCGGDFEETVRCKKCGGEFLADELYGSYYCLDCLKESLTLESFLRYATAGYATDEVTTLEDFMLREMFEIESDQEILSKSSAELKTVMRNLYKQAVKADKLYERYSGEERLLTKIRAYMKDWGLWEDFAEWLYGEEVSK